MLFLNLIEKQLPRYVKKLSIKFIQLLIVKLNFGELYSMNLKQILVLIIRSKIFIPFISFYVSTKIRKFSNIRKHKNNLIISILVLNEERWLEEINVLDSDPRVQVLVLPSETQSLISSFFLSTLRGKFKGVSWADPKYSNLIRPIMSLYVEYLRLFIPSLSFFKQFDFIGSCSFYYFQDHPWQKASSISGKPFICFHKENQKDDSVLEYMIKVYRNRAIKFYGRLIFVYNNKEKECMERSGIVSPEKIVVTGSMRMDKLLPIPKSSIYDEHINSVTLFSFRHAFGGMRLGEDEDIANGGFSFSGNTGCVNYFNHVHGAIAKFALDNPSVPVYIKPKWMGGWYESIAKAIKKETGFYPDEINNLRIGIDIKAQDLINCSKVIIGINSTALIESRIMGRKVIIPVFDELITKYDKHIYYKKYFDNEFVKVNNTTQLNQEIYKLLNEKNTSPASNNLITEFLGFNDSNSKNRVLQSMSAIKLKSS